MIAYDYLVTNHVKLIFINHKMYFLVKILKTNYFD